MDEGPSEFMRFVPEGAIEEVENKTRFVCQKRLRERRGIGRRLKGRGDISAGKERTARRSGERDTRCRRAEREKEARGRRSGSANFSRGAPF